MLNTKLPYYFEWSREFPHIAKVDLYGNSVGYEIAVVAIDERNGDLYFIRLDQLDSIDLRRLRSIITSRDSARYALWDLLDNKVLPNGVNALEFFDQFVKGRTVQGEIFNPRSGSSGIPSFTTELGYKGPEAYGYTSDEVDGNDEVGNDNSYELQSDGVTRPAPRKAGRPRKVR